MNVEKLKLITNNLESLVRILKEELYGQEEQNYSVSVPFSEDDVDEVYVE